MGELQKCVVCVHEEIRVKKLNYQPTWIKSINETKTELLRSSNTEIDTKISTKGEGTQ